MAYIGILHDRSNVPEVPGEGGALYESLHRGPAGERRELGGSGGAAPGLLHSTRLGVFKAYRDDGHSAKTLDRPALQRLMEDAKARRFEAVLAFKLDRLTRSVRDLGTLLEFFDKRGVALVSLSESFDATTAAGRLMVNLLGYPYPLM